MLYRVDPQNLRVCITFFLLTLLIACGGSSETDAPTSNTAITPISEGSQVGTGSNSASETPPETSTETTVESTIDSTPNPLPVNTSQSGIQVFESFVVNDASVVAGSEVQVRMVSNSGFDLSYNVVAENDAMVELFVPFDYLANGSTELDVMINGQFALSLSVNAMQETQLATGRMSLLFLESVIGGYDDTIATIEEGLFDNSITDINTAGSALIELENRNNWVKDYYDAIADVTEFGNTYNLVLPNGSQITVDTQHVTQMDRYVQAFIVAALNNSTDATITEAGLNTRANNHLLRAGFDFSELTTEAGVRRVLDRALSGLDTGVNGARVLLGTVGVGVGVAGYYLTTSAATFLGATAAATVSGTFGIVLVGGAIFWEFTNARALKEIFQDPSGAVSQIAGELGSKLQDLALAVCGTVSAACGLVGLGKSANDTYNDIVKFYCQRFPGGCANTTNGTCPTTRNQKSGVAFKALGVRNVQAGTVCAIPTVVLVVPATQMPLPEPEPTTDPMPVPQPIPEPMPTPEPQADAHRLMLVTNYSGDGYLTTALESQFDEPPLLSTFEGGGISNELRAEWEYVNDEGFESADAAAASYCGEITCFYRPVLARFIQKAVTGIGDVGISQEIFNQCPVVATQSCP